MKRTTILLILLTMFANFLAGQESLSLTFSGRRGDDRYQRLDYLTVRNTVRDWQDILYYPDTTFVINLYTSVDDFLDTDLIRVTPNPFHGETRIAIEMPLSSQLTISVYDLMGALCARYQSELAAGAYSFLLRLNKPNLYLLSVAFDDSQYATKVISLGGDVNDEIELVSSNKDPRLFLAWYPTDHPFEFGDVMEYIGYIDDGNVVEESNIKTQPQYGDEDIILQFDALLPEVATTAVSDITQTEATCLAEVTYDGGTSVTDRGICWSTESEPTIDGTHISCGGGTGSFSAQMTDLNVCTAYYVRSYAVNSVGIVYGNEISFTTLAFLPTIATLDVLDITQITATCRCELTYDGGASITDKGLCWSTEPEPTISNAHVSNGEGYGDFAAQMTGLIKNTTYYVRSYAVNSAGIGYGNELSFTTLPLDDIKILSIGNSYSEDALSYVPFILENMNVDANLQIGILCKSGGTLAQHVNGFVNQLPNYVYYHYDGGGAWQNLGEHTIQYGLDNYDWDYILFQQVSYNAPNWSTYQPSLNTLIDLISNYLDYSVQFGWYLVQSRPGSGVNGSNYSEETIDANYSSIAINAQRVLNETACEFVVPVGTAIQNARTIPEIKALGDYANLEENTSGLGYLTPDGVHLQEGLPCQIAAYSFVLSILDLYGALQAYPIIGESTRVTQEWMNGKHIPGIDGTPVGSNDVNCLIGQQSAVEAFNNPYEVTNMNKKLFKSRH